MSKVHRVLDEKKIAAVILAAGRSQRMGFPKPLMAVGHELALARVIRQCHEAEMSPVVVVLGFHAQRIEENISLSACVTVHNPTPDRGQTSSLKAALAVVPSESAICLYPVDHAAVRSATVRQLVGEFLTRESRYDLVLPVFQGRRGHPLLFSNNVRREFELLDDEEPAHTVVRRDSDRIRLSPSTDPAVVRDFDTPKDAASLDAWPPTDREC